MQTIWVGPTNYVSGDPSLRISYPYVSHPSTIVGGKSKGDFKWIAMSLSLPANVAIEQVIICYKVSNSRSSILQIRISEMSTPDHALVLHDDPTPLQSTNPVCYTSVIGGIVPNPGAAVMLELRLNFQNTTDQIFLGSVGVVVNETVFRGTVPNIAALRTIPTSFTGPVVVEGFSIAGDGGGGVFYWDTSGVYLLDDNIGIVIQSNFGGGRWRREGFLHGRNPSSQDVNYTNQGVNVKWFGAMGDGVTDDAPAIQHAVNAADQIRSNLSQVNQGPGLLGGFFATVALIIPDGDYNVTGSINGNTGIDAGGCVLSIQGVGRAVLSTQDPTLNILRIGAWGHVKNIIFRGGLHQIALYGYNINSPGLIDPTAFGNVPIVIEDCNFAFPVGPAIWQDIGPSTAIATGSDGAVLPQATIHVTVATTSFPPTGQITIALQDGTYQTVNYTGKTANTFTGCTGGVGTLHIGGFVVIPTMWRSFQSTLRVSNFTFSGPHFYWGCGDSATFQLGHIMWDFTTPQLSGDGYPLGLFNSSDTIWVDHVSAFGTGTSLPRQSIFVGVGSMQITSTDWGQNDFLCFVRSRVHANTYASAAGIQVTMPYGYSDPGYVDLAIDNVGMVSAFGAFWLEVYEAFPAALKLKNWADAFDFVGTLGIWLDSRVNLTAVLGNHSVLNSIEFDGFDWGAHFRFWQGFDPGASVAPTYTVGTTEVTDVFRLYRVEEDKPGDTSSQVNLFATHTADAGPGPLNFGLTGNTRTIDTSTGYPVTLCTATDVSPYVAAMQITNSSLWLPTNLAAGIYCVSIYWKSNFSGRMRFTIAPAPNPGVTNAERKYEASDNWQRLWVPFYYPGNNTDFVLNLVSYVAPTQKINIWTGLTVYAVGKRVTNGGNVYLATSTTGTSAGAGGPSGTGSNIVDGTVTWNYVGPGGTFTPACAMGLMMLNKGRHPAPYVFPGNNDVASSFGYVPRIYYGAAAPTTGTYQVGDMTYNTAPTPGGTIGWVCTAAGSPGTWKPFGGISM